MNGMMNGRREEGCVRRKTLIWQQLPSGGASERSPQMKMGPSSAVFRRHSAQVFIRFAKLSETSTQRVAR